MAAITSQFPGLGHPDNLPIAGAFYWAMLAKAERYQRQLDLVDAFCLTSMEKSDAQTLQNRYIMLASGPGALVSWLETLTKREREGIAAAEAAAEATRAGWKASGLDVDSVMDAPLDLAAFKKATRRGA